MFKLYHLPNVSSLVIIAYHKRDYKSSEKEILYAETCPKTINPMVILILIDIDNDIEESTCRTLITGLFE